MNLADLVQREIKNPPSGSGIDTEVALTTGNDGVVQLVEQNCMKGMENMDLGLPLKLLASCRLLLQRY